MPSRLEGSSDAGAIPVSTNQNRLRRARARPLLAGIVLLAACAGNGSDVPPTDVHPWLLERAAEDVTDQVPAEYPFEVDHDGGTVIYDRGPTPGGFAWLVINRHGDGTVEILELDEEGEVQARTYGTIGDAP